LYKYHFSIDKADTRGDLNDVWVSKGAPTFTNFFLWLFFVL